MSMLICESKDGVITNKEWVIAPKLSSNIIKQILLARGIKESEHDVFLNPKYDEGLIDPFKLKGMKKAVDRIEKAILNEEKVGIFGDYDADGIPATALLNDILVLHGSEVCTFIPRRNEGYGLSRRGIQELASKGVKLIITVDLGITGKEEIAFAKAQGIDIIVSDHHEPIEALFPVDACSVINPKQKGCKYPFKELSGTAVAFKLVSALCLRSRRLSDSQLKWYLDLVAISIFCDMVPLLGENRIFGKFGLIVLQKTKRLGLDKLYKVASIVKDQITPYTVGFGIGPRLNAPGRMGDCEDSLKLLMTQDDKEALDIARRLDDTNTKRQNLLKEVLEEALGIVEEEGLDRNKIILVAKEGWPEGIIGLVAGRIAEKYNRPAFVIGFKDGIGRGSARSPEGIDLVKVLNYCRKYLIKHGGHSMAAGLTIKTQHIAIFYKKLLAIAESEISSKSLTGRIYCDCKVNLDDIDWGFFRELRKLEPFGSGNPRPVFVTNNLTCGKITVMGKTGEHLKIELSDGKTTRCAVGFGLAGKFSNLSVGGKIDIAYSVDRNDWQGKESLQLKILDIKLRMD
ncbi:MAG: single-stranded-DNA-specific exonuclease RecJ [bacterium]|nr:single-stranded-DNA-specific exonuclease RecJ [bacterium]